MNKHKIYRTYNSYKTYSTGNCIAMPNICSVCAKPATHHFKVKGKGLGDITWQTKEISTKFPLCNECYRKMQTGKIITAAYHMLCGLIIMFTFLLLVNKSHSLLLLIPFLIIESIIWTFGIVPWLIKSGKAIPQFLYKNLTDMPHIVDVVPVGNDICFEFTNFTFANAFSNVNGTYLNTVTNKEKKHLFWQMILSICYSITASLIFSLFIGLISKIFK